GVPGGANVGIYGQRDRQLQVQVDPKKLRAEHVTLTQLIETAGNALWVSPLTFVEASTPGTGGFFESANQRLSVQHISPISTPQQLAAVPVQDSGKLRLGDVANVIEDHQPLIGDAVSNGHPSLFLVIEKFRGADTLKVTRDVEAAMADMAPAVCIVADDVITDINTADGITAEAAEGEAPVRAAFSAVRGPLVFATLALLLGTVPFLFLGSVVTAFSRPLVLAFALAVLASMVVSLLLTPTLGVLLLRGPHGR